MRWRGHAIRPEPSIYPQLRATCPIKWPATHHTRRSLTRYWFFRKENFNLAGTFARWRGRATRPGPSLYPSTRGSLWHVLWSKGQPHVVQEGLWCATDFPQKEKIFFFWTCYSVAPPRVRTLSAYSSFAFLFTLVGEIVELSISTGRRIQWTPSRPSCTPCTHILRACMHTYIKGLNACSFSDECLAFMHILSWASVWEVDL